MPVMSASRMQNWESKPRASSIRKKRTDLEVRYNGFNADFRLLCIIQGDRQVCAPLSTESRRIAELQG